MLSLSLYLNSNNEVYSEGQESVKASSQDTDVIFVHGLQGVRIFNDYIKLDWVSWALESQSYWMWTDKVAQALKKLQSQLYKIEIEIRLIELRLEYKKIINPFLFTYNIECDIQFDLHLDDLYAEKLRLLNQITCLEKVLIFLEDCFLYSYSYDLGTLGFHIDIKLKKIGLSGAYSGADILNEACQKGIQYIQETGETITNPLNWLTVMSYRIIRHLNKERSAYQPSANFRLYQYFSSKIKLSWMEEPPLHISIWGMSGAAGKTGFLASISSWLNNRNKIELNIYDKNQEILQNPLLHQTRITGVPIGTRLDMSLPSRAIISGVLATGFVIIDVPGVDKASPQEASYELADLLRVSDWETSALCSCAWIEHCSNSSFLQEILKSEIRRAISQVGLLLIKPLRKLFCSYTWQIPERGLETIAFYFRDGPLNLLGLMPMLKSLTAMFRATGARLPTQISQ